MAAAASSSMTSEVGRIAPGYRASLVLLDDDMDAKRTWIEGTAGIP